MRTILGNIVSQAQEKQQWQIKVLSWLASDDADYVRGHVSAS